MHGSVSSGPNKFAKLKRCTEMFVFNQSFWTLFPPYWIYICHLHYPCSWNFFLDLQLGHVGSCCSLCSFEFDHHCCIDCDSPHTSNHGIGAQEKSSNCITLLPTLFTLFTSAQTAQVLTTILYKPGHSVQISKERLELCVRCEIDSANNLFETRITCKQKLKYKSFLERLSMTIDLVKWVHKVKCSDDSEEGILQGWQTSYTWSHLRSDLSHILTSTAPIYQV